MEEGREGGPPLTSATVIGIHYLSPLSLLLGSCCPDIEYEAYVSTHCDKVNLECWSACGCGFDSHCVHTYSAASFVVVVTLEGLLP